MATLAARGSGTPTTTGTTWASVTSAVDGAAGTNPATYATLTSTTSGAVATIEVSGYGFSSIAATATLNTVTVSLRHFENNTGRFASVRFQPYDGATAIGTLQTATLATSARNDSFTFPVTLAQLRSATFKVRVTITGAASTQSRVESIDYIDVTADYTPLVPKTGTATLAHAWSTTASGTAPVPAAPGSRALESGGGRITEGAAARLLETAAAPPNQGSSTYTHSWSTTAAGKRTAKGAAVTTYVETTAGAGKRVPKGASTTTYVEALAGAGKRAPKSPATTSYVETVTGAGKRTAKGASSLAHIWTPTAAGVKPAVGVKQGTAAFTHHQTTSAAGKKAPKGTSATTWRETVTAAGKRVLRGAAVITWQETTGAAGKRVAKASAVVVYVEIIEAQGVRDLGGDVIGYWQGQETIEAQWIETRVVAWQLDGVGARVTLDA